MLVRQSMVSGVVAVVLHFLLGCGGNEVAYEETVRPHLPVNCLDYQGNPAEPDDRSSLVFSGQGEAQRRIFRPLSHDPG